MPEIVIDRYKISSHFKANVNIISDFDFVAFEVRATKIGEPYMRSCGYDLISDDKSEAYYIDNSIAYTYEPVRNISFDIEAGELSGDGEYRISVYLKTADGIWSDACCVYTNNSQLLVDCNGAYIYVQRNLTGTDESFVSLFSGEEIEKFICEVLNYE